MDTEALKALVIQLAAVAERLDQRSRSAVQQVEQAGAMLDQRAHRLGSSSADFTREVSNALQRQSGEFIGKGLGDSIGEFKSQLTACARAASAAARTLESERQALSRERRTWLWLASGALLVASTLAMVSSFHAVVTSRKEVERNQIAADLLRAYDQADVRLCGQRLCANVDDSRARQGADNQYRLVKTRPPSAR
jgi:hypothetical protein